MLMLKHVRLLDPPTRTDDIRDIVISDRKVMKIGTDLELDARMMARAKGEVLNVIDCTGLCAAPGFVDGHVHFRDPGLTYKEDIQTGARAAAAGGFTSVVCMANTKPTVDSEETIVDVIRKGRQTPIHVYSCSAVTKGLKGEELVDMKLMKECGAVGFTDDGIPLMNEALAREAMLTARRLKLPLSFHEEDPQYITEPGINAGAMAQRMGLTGTDRKAESVMVERDVRLARETGATVVIQHISAKESVELVRKGKRSGARVFAEATPHHFSLTEDAVSLYGSNAKMNPPLRTEEDRQAIIRGLQDGTIGVIATDHAPHHESEKNIGLEKSANGIVGLETSVPVSVTTLVKSGKLSPLQLIDRMSTTPGRILGKGKGTLQVGAPADIVLIDAETPYTIDKEKFETMGRNTPFDGWNVYGRVCTTIYQGRIVYQEGNIIL